MNKDNALYLLMETLDNPYENHSKHIITCTHYTIYDFNKEYPHRHLLSHMMNSHIFLLAPSVYWLFGSNEGPFIAHIVDKLMASTMTLSILMSMVYHYYYECVLCDAEYYSSIFGAFMLNVYMFYRQVHYTYILLGFIILLGLEYSIQCFRRKNIKIFEKYHPYCHYIGGFYVAYCVYHIETTYSRM